MWNKLKGFLGFLILAGCVLIFLSFTPVVYLLTHSGQLEHYGFLLMGFGSLTLLIVLILLGINEHIYRFKPEHRRAIRRSKRVTRKVAAISLLALIITGLGWFVVRPHLLASGPLAPDEVMGNPKNYVGKKVAVVGYFFPTMGDFDFDGWVCPTNYSEANLVLGDLIDLCLRKQILPADLPLGEYAYSCEKYVFIGFVIMEHVKRSPCSFPYKVLPKIVVLSLRKV